jgi:hypothetical protein
MINPNSNTSGFHNNAYGWQFRWSNGVAYVGKNAYGGGTDAIVLDSSNYTIYSPSLTGSGANGTWSINITGSAGSATSASSTTYLAALGNYVWSASTLPQGYAQGIQCSFVYSGWQNYGSVMTMNTYSGGGGALQLYVPYGVSFGGTGLQVRFGNYDVSNGNSWTGWKTLLASDNYTSYAPSLTGSGASGTWGINVTGTAGSISGYNNPTSGATANTIAYRDSGGDIYQRYSFAVHFNQSGGNSENPTIGQIWTNSTSDNYVRKSTPAHFISQLGLITTSNYSSYALPLSGGTISGDITVSNGRKGLVGVYDPVQTQAVFAMGASYKLTDGGSSSNYGNFYGLGWSYDPNYGGSGNNPQSKAGLGHQLLLMMAGTTRTALGTGIWTDGNITATANITAYSDERLKTNWQPMPENYVTRLAQVKVGIYDRIDGDKITQVGVSAQSFQKLLPEAILTAKDEMQTLSVSYGNAALASAVELAKHIVKQDERIARLEALIQTLLKDR